MIRTDFCYLKQKYIYSTGRGESHGYLNETDPCPYSVFHETVAASFLLSLSLPLPSLFSLPPPLSSPYNLLLALLSFPKCFNQIDFSISLPCTHVSPGTISPKQSHRNQITETLMYVINGKKFAEGWSWTRVLSVHKRVCYPLGHVESTKYEGKNVLFVQEREGERDREKEREGREIILFVCSFIRSFVHLFFRLFTVYMTCATVGAFRRASVHLFVRSLVQSFVRLGGRSFVHSLVCTQKIVRSFQLNKIRY